ncbi:MAG: hypothetical protein Sapg2KO_45910 [Saprospiraceae bacterium]
MILGACQVNRQGDNNLVIDVDDDFRLTFLENLVTPGDDVIFSLESILNRQCEADTVTMLVDHYVSAIAINIDVVNTTGVCRPGETKISTSATTDPLPKDRMALSIKLETLIANQGNLLIDDETITVNMETTNGFYLPYESMRKVPDHLVWGFVSLSTASRPGAQQFVDRLNSLTSAAEIGEGQYGYFSISSDTDLTVMEEQELDIPTQPFLRSFKLEDTQQIEALFNEIKEQYPSLKMILRDSYGTILR